MCHSGWSLGGVGWDKNINANLNMHGTQYHALGLAIGWGHNVHVNLNALWVLFLNRTLCCTCTNTCTHTHVMLRSGGLLVHLHTHVMLRSGDLLLQLRALERTYVVWSPDWSTEFVCLSCQFYIILWHLEVKFQTGLAPRDWVTDWKVKCPIAQTSGWETPRENSMSNSYTNWLEFSA